ncbi:MAG: hypothetical protein FJ304_25025 [Planctomycetes bacterium]|nr:hypothetical protein [Planctomycetota bacterium]
MTLRRLLAAMTLVCGLCVWGFARSGGDEHETAPAARNARDDAAARYRANQSTHWRHVAVGSAGLSR